MIKMVVSDMDGTLLKSDFSLSAVNLQAIKMLKEKKIEFLPASGRCYKDILSIFEPHGVQCGAIEINGAQVRDQHGCVLLTRELPEKEVMRCIEKIESMGLSLQIFTSDGCYAYKDAEKLQRDMDEVISRNMGKPADVERLLPIDELHRQTVLKLECMSMDEDKLKDCQHELSVFSELIVTSSVRGNLEITSKEANKGDALKELLLHYGISKDEVIVFGDSMNDSSMFEQFPKTIAVKNAVPFIREHASAVCGACEEDGVGYWLMENLCK